MTMRRRLLLPETRSHFLKPSETPTSASVLGMVLAVSDPDPGNPRFIVSVVWFLWHRSAPVRTIAGLFFFSIKSSSSLTSYFWRVPVGTIRRKGRHSEWNMVRPQPTYWAASLSESSLGNSRVCSFTGDLRTWVNSGRIVGETEVLAAGCSCVSTFVDHGQSFLHYKCSNVKQLRLLFL